MPGSDMVVGGAPLLNAANTDPFLQGLEYLGGWENPAGGAAVAASTVVTVPARDTLIVLGRAVWGATAGYLAMRVGTTPGAVDSTAIYRDRNVISRGGDGGIFYGTNAESTTQWPLQYTGNAIFTDDGSAQPRSFMVIINNFAGMSKTANWLVGRATGAAATIGVVHSGWGEYVNLAPQIRSLQIKTFTDTAMLAADTGFGVFGRNY